MRRMTRHLLVSFALVAALMSGAPATPSAQTTVMSYESVAVAGTAIGFAAATIRPSTTEPAVAFCSGRLETAQIRFRFDGTDPTASEGILLEVGEILDIRGATNIQRLRMIRTGGTSGTFKAHCGKD